MEEISQLLRSLLRMQPSVWRVMFRAETTRNGHRDCNWRPSATSRLQTKTLMRVHQTPRRQSSQSWRGRSHRSIPKCLILRTTSTSWTVHSILAHYLTDCITTQRCRLLSGLALHTTPTRQTNSKLPRKFKIFRSVWNWKQARMKKQECLAATWSETKF